MKLWLSTIIKFGTKKVVHVQGSSTQDLIQAANEVGVGVRNAGEKYEHITVSPAQARTLSALFRTEQLEGDIYDNN